MNTKENKVPKGEPSEIVCLGIPTFNRAEKLTEVIPVKVQHSLKKIIPKPQSAWIREAIIQRFQRMEEEKEDFE